MAAEPQPDWLPDGVPARQVDGGAWHLTVTAQAVPFGVIPDGMTVRLNISNRTAVTVSAASVGNAVTLELGGPNSTVTVPPSFRRVEVVAPGASMTVRLAGASTNVYVHHQGAVTLNAQDPDRGARCALRAFAAPLTVRGDVVLRLLDTPGDTTLQARLAREADVSVAGDLTVSHLDVETARVGGAVVVDSIAPHTAVEAQRVEVHRPGQGRLGTVGDGCNITSYGDVKVGGHVGGTENHPVRITAGEAATVHIANVAAHCLISAPEGGTLERVDAGSLCHARIPQAATIDIRGPVSDSSLTATGPVTVRGAVDRSDVTGEVVSLLQVTTAPARIVGDTITVGPTHPAEGTQELVEIIPSASATLSAPAAASISTSEDATDAIRVAVGTKALPAGDQVIGADRESSLKFPPANGGSGSINLALRGQSIVAVAGDCTLKSLSDVEHMLVSGDVILTGGEADCRQLAASGDVKLHGTRLTVESCEARGVEDGTVVASGTITAQTADRVVLVCAALTLTGDAHDVDLTVEGELTIEGGVHGTGKLNAGGRAELQAASGDTEITLRASADISGPAPGHVVWRPFENTAELRLADEVGRLTIEVSTAEPVTLTLEEASTVGSAEVDGPLAVSIGQPKNPHKDDRLGVLTLRDGAAVSVDPGGGPLTTALELAGGRSAGFVHLEGRGTARLIIAKSGEHGLLTLTSANPEQCALISAPGDGQMADLPVTVLSFGRFALHGSHRRVHAGDTVDIDQHDVNEWEHRPVLAVPADGLLDHISGEFAVKTCEGRVVGRSPARRRQGPRPPDGPARLLDSSRFPGVEASALAGTMVNVDVSQVGFAELKRLEDLHVFSPLPAPLRELAKDSGSRTTRHDTAQRLTAIAEMTSKRAVSGATRSSALWASTRAHHRTTHGFEQGVRWLHWAVGYGQRFLPALATFLGAVAATALVIGWLEPSSCYDPDLATDAEPTFQHGPYSLGEQVLRVLLVPLGLIRLAATEGQGYAPIFCHPLGQLIVTIVVGLPLVFLLIAIRNYLRSPAD